MIGRCRPFRRLSASDDPEDRRAVARHAETCASCRALLEQHDRLAGAARAWAEADVDPPAALEARIVSAVARELRGPAPIAVMPARSAPRTARHPLPRRARGPALAAAILIVSGAGIAIRWGFAPPGKDAALARALETVDRAHEEYTLAIADLETAAREVFAQAGEPGFDARRAALLRNYRDRLTHLDTVIAEVRLFLDQNPGHAGGHTVLLAAYRETADVLREVVSTRKGTSL